jgi:MFS family permease
VYAPSFLYAIGLGLLIPVIPLFARELGATVALASFVVAMRGLGIWLSDVPAGIVASRFGARPAMVAATGGTAVVALAIGLTMHVPLLFVLVFLNGVTWAMWNVARLAFVAGQVPPQHRGRAIALVGGVNRFGQIAGPLIGGVVGVAFGLDAVFFAQAAVSVVAMAILIRHVPSTAGESLHEEGGAHRRLAGTLARHRRVFLTTGMAALALVLIRNGRLALVPLWGDSIGLDVKEINLIFSAAFAIDTLLVYPTGIAMDRWGRKSTFVPSLVLLSTSLILLPLADGFASLLFVGLLSGAANGLSSGVVMTLGADLAPEGRPGEFLGVWRTIADSGSFIGPSAIGALAQVLTLGAASVATGGVGLLGAAVMVFLAAETLDRGARDRSP